MTKKLYICGNGLGRAFDNDFYSLERAMKESWNNDSLLTDAQKELICGCLDDDVIEEDDCGPTAEHQLTDLQRVITACDLISDFESKLSTGTEAWLTDRGKEFPQAIRRYFHDVASRFHDPEMQLPSEFAEKLRAFVRAKRPHIATLNYDDLLYECFTETTIFTQHILRDGFFRSFDFERHEQLYSPNEGWFLHLHGSPLFVNRRRDPVKVRRSELGLYQGTNSNHLVLTNATSKPSVIQNSVVLKNYWRKLNEIVNAGAEVTLFGYGGGDLHLNDLLAKTGESTTVRIVCRNGDDDSDQIEERWHKLLRGKDTEQITVLPYDNILDFDDW